MTEWAVWCKLKNHCFSVTLVNLKNSLTSVTQKQEAGKTSPLGWLCPQVRILSNTKIPPIKILHPAFGLTFFFLCVFLEE